MSRRVWVYKPEHPEADQFGCVPKEILYREEPPVKRGLYVIPDMEAYRCIATDQMVDGRAQHREHVRRNNFIEVGTESIEAPEHKPLPPSRDTVERARSMMDQGYRPPPIESIGDWNFD